MAEPSAPMQVDMPWEKLAQACADGTLDENFTADDRDAIMTCAKLQAVKPFMLENKDQIIDGWITRIRATDEAFGSASCQVFECCLDIFKSIPKEWRDETVELLACCLDQYGAHWSREINRVNCLVAFADIGQYVIQDKDDVATVRHWAQFGFRVKPGLEQTGGDVDRMFKWCRSAAMFVLLLDIHDYGHAYSKPDRLRVPTLVLRELAQSQAPPDDVLQSARYFCKQVTSAYDQDKFDTSGDFAFVDALDRTEGPQLVPMARVPRWARYTMSEIINWAHQQPVRRNVSRIIYALCESGWYNGDMLVHTLHSAWKSELTSKLVLLERECTYLAIRSVPVLNTNVLALVCLYVGYGPFTDDMIADPQSQQRKIVQKFVQMYKKEDPLTRLDAS